MNPENNNANIPGAPQGTPTPNTPQGTPIPQGFPPSPQAQMSQDLQRLRQPVMNPAQQATPQTAGPAQPQQMQSTLNVPVMSPTHFDRPVNPAPIVPDPAEAQKDSPERIAKKFTKLAIVTSILAGVFLILAVVGLIFSVVKNDELETAKADLQNKNAIVAALENTTGETITTAEDVPVFKTTHGYIYVDEWGIKIQVPDQLTSVSYILDQKYRPTICFNALKDSATTFPAFADVAQNPGGMGCLTRVAVTEGNSDKDGRSFGLLVKTIDDYNYFYTDPARVYSQDAAEQGLEQESAQLIKNMLVDGVSPY